MRALVLVALALLLAACEREQRTLVQPPKTAETVKTMRMNDLVSGDHPSAGNAYERNAQALADGKRLFDWFNCSGCHAQGGGDKGPALMDDKWLYGSEPENISKLDADFGFVYAPVRFTVDIGRLSLQSSNPALTLTQLSGSVTVAGDDVHINRLNTRLPESELRVDGVIRNYAKGAQFDLDVASQKLTFTEIGTLLPALRHMEVQPSFTIKVTGPLSRLQSILEEDLDRGKRVTVGGL